ncbi:putative peroxiredoxin bcp [compost metagenome]
MVLGSDEDGVVTEAWGVWVLKKLYGREYMGVERATFVIDGQGVVRRAWRNVKVKGHAEEVLDAVEAL